jgi:teichuronic acid biosynthesis glycosyltransferase TuaC
MEAPIRVLMITSGWPQPGQPQTTHFIVQQVEFLRRAGVEVEVFQFRGKKKLTNYVSAWRKVRPLLKSGRYDLVHAQFGQSGLLALPKAIPLVVTFHGDDIQGLVDDRLGRVALRGKLQRSLSRIVARHADAVVVVSNHMRAFFRTAAPVVCLPCGLDLELFRPIPRDEARRRLGWPLDQRKVLFAANPATWRKRHPLAKAAVDLVNTKMPTELVVAWGLSHEDIPVYMSACDALVFTSTQEGSPCVVKEALACNLPIVSVPVADVPERLEGVRGCVLCPDERPETIAAGLERVLRRGERAEGRAAVLELSEAALMQRLIGVYRTVLGRSSNGSEPAETPGFGAAGGIATAAARS